MNVLIVGINGLGIEIAKNLILAGPGSVTLYDSIFFIKIQMNLLL